MSISILSNKSHGYLMGITHAPLYSVFKPSASICRQLISKSLKYQRRVSVHCRNMATEPAQNLETTAKITIIKPDASSPNKFWKQSLTAGSKKALDTRLLYSSSELNALVSLGNDFAKKESNVRREVLRKAAGTAVEKVKDVALSAGVKSIEVNLEDAKDEEMDVQAAAVGSYLALHNFTLQTKKDANPGKNISIRPDPKFDTPEWNRGKIYAEAQILARELTELPANMLTPTNFCERIQEEFSHLPASVTEKIEIHVRDKEWAEKMGMRTFLSVAKGTTVPPKLLEIHYKASPDPNARPLALVGKGITFDSGGISIKPATNMKAMRGDMGGAAAICAATLAIAKLQIPINLVVVTPLTENMPGPAANKPGDIVYAMNGKTVEIDNTDAEGRLILSDALYYASSKFNPHTVIDVATLTGAMVVSVGNVYSGVFSTSDSLWSALHAAGEHEHDRFWRFPLDDEFGPLIWKSNADLCNTGGRDGGSCTAALFLKAFVDGIEPSEEGEEPRVKWAHIDIAGSSKALRSTPYLSKGMTGRPTRALIEFANRLAKDSEQ